VAAVDCGAVKVSERIDDHAVIGKAAIWRALKRLNNTLNPLASAFEPLRYYGVRKILPVYGSSTAVPGGKPVTST